MSGGGGSAPEAPDYNTLARIQSALDREAAQEQTQANRVNQVNPYQSLTWTNNPTTQRSFDADAYASALDAYSNQSDAPGMILNPAWTAAGGGSGLGGSATGHSGDWRGNSSSGAASGPAGVPRYIQDPNWVSSAPNREDFYTDRQVDNWTQEVTLRPELQQALDMQMGALPGMLGGALDNMGNPLDLSGLSSVERLNLGNLPGVQGFNFGQLPGVDQLDLSSLGAMPDSGFGAVQEIQDAMLGRLNPALEQGRNREVQRLKAQGITEGSPAWESAMRSLNQQDVDANQQALLGAMGASQTLFSQGMQSRQQGLGELLAGRDAQTQDYLRGLNEQQLGFDSSMTLRQQGLQEALQSRGASIDDRQRELQELLMEREQPLNDLNNLLGLGSNIGAQGGGFEGYTQATPWQAPDVLGSAQQQYQTQVGQYNANQQAAANRDAGLMGLVGTIGAALMSDRRAKTNIEKVGRIGKLGLNLYKFSYRHDVTRKYVGVMADEVKQLYPDCVVNIGGLDHVNYGRLGVEMVEV